MNNLSKAKEVKEIVMPSKVSVGNTTTKGGAFASADSFHNTNVDLRDNLTINPKHNFPMDNKQAYIQVMLVRVLYPIQYTIHSYSFSCAYRQEVCY